MESFTERPPLDAPAIDTPLTRWRPKERSAADKATRRGTKAAGEQAVEERFCFECGDARYNRSLSICECGSAVSEFARQQVFSGQVACGWFVRRRSKRRVKWSVCSGRML
jgi:hypothetical protein